LGAGSVSDAAKMVGLCLGNGVSAAERLDASRATIAPTGQARGLKAHDGTTRRPAVEPPAVRMIAIPTTLSAGEFSAGADGTDTARHVKESFGHRQMMPRTVILDPAASVSTPEQRRRRFHTEGRHRRSRPYRPLHLRRPMPRRDVDHRVEPDDEYHRWNGRCVRLFGAKQAVAGVVEPGEDPARLVEAAIGRRRDDRHVRKPTRHPEFTNSPAAAAGKSARSRAGTIAAPNTTRSTTI
jgi:hypothetical protein